MADQQARVELGRIQAGLAEGVGQRAARLRDGHVRASDCASRHQAPSAASSSA